MSVIDTQDILDFLTKQVRNGDGAVELCLTESGDIGVFISGLRRPQGVGDTVEGAVREFIRSGENPHKLPLSQ